MKTIYRFAHLVILAPLLLLSMSLHAQGPFDGTWRLNLNSVQPSQRPESYLLANGRFKCMSCVEMKMDLDADGQDHPVSGSKYADTASVRIVDAHTVEVTHKLKGKVISEDKNVVSSDGKTLTDDSTYHPEGSSQVVRETDVYTRVGQAPPGSHAMSGEWRQTKIESASENGMVVTLKDTPEGLKMSLPTGEGWDAKFDGKEYPTQNDPGQTMVSLKRIDSHTIEETDSRDGKVVSHVRWQVLPDEKTIKYSYHDERTGADTVSLAQKQ